jgi:murein DD-endopeptidase MepM/ murein hydrolase activator NlpD
MLPMLIVLIAAVATVVPAPAPIAEPPYQPPRTAQGTPGNPSAPAPSGRAPALRMPVVGTVVRGFEEPAGQYGPGHRGIDLAAPVGERVAAPAAGRVVFAGPVAGRGWVSLLVAPGVVVTVGPLLQTATAVGPSARALDPVVVMGRRVRALDPLGRLGPGHAGSLHLSLRIDGVYVDPLPYLVDRPRPRLAPLLAPGGRPGPGLREA